MKNYLRIIAMLCVLASCKKSSQNSHNTESTQLKIQVTGIGAYTNYTIGVINYTHNQLGFTIYGAKDSTFYQTADAGDQLSISYNIDYIPPNTDGFLGDGTINFTYNGKIIRTIVNGQGVVTNYIPQP